MKFITLVRHAKAARPSGTDDFDRPLNARGQAEARETGAVMAAHGIAPDIALCSPSRRTRETLDLILPSLSGAMESLFEEGLYVASADDILKRIRDLPDAFAHVLFVGHNPAMHALALDLADAANDPGALSDLRSNFGTGALAQFEFDAWRWKDVRAGCGSLLHFVEP